MKTKCKDNTTSIIAFMTFLQSFLIVVNIIVGLLIVIAVLFSSMGSDGILSQGEKFLPGSVDAFRNKFIAVLVGIFIINILVIGTISIDRNAIKRIGGQYSTQESSDGSLAIGDEE